MGVFDEIPDYSPNFVDPSPNKGYLDQVDSNYNRSNRPTSDFRDELNQDVKQKSNLLGPSQDPANPESEALNARGNQIYNSEINRMMRRSEPLAVDRKMNLQTQNLDQRAALYQNAQTRAMHNWKQISFQREAAITQEATRRQLYASIFGGLGSVGGAFAAKGLYNAARPTPTEGHVSANNGQDIFNRAPGSATPYSFNSENFGEIVGSGE